MASRCRTGQPSYIGYCRSVRQPDAIAGFVTQSGTKNWASEDGTGMVFCLAFLLYLHVYIGTSAKKTFDSILAIYTCNSIWIRICWSFWCLHGSELRILPQKCKVHIIRKDQTVGLKYNANVCYSDLSVKFRHLCQEVKFSKRVRILIHWHCTKFSVHLPVKKVGRIFFSHLLFCYRQKSWRTACENIQECMKIWSMYACVSRLAVFRIRSEAKLFALADLKLDPECEKFLQTRYKNW